MGVPSLKRLRGAVCVHKLDNVYDHKYDGWWQKSNTKGLIDWRLGGVLDRNYDYLRTYPSYCAFLDLQCRSNIAHGYGWAFLHMGSCARDEDTFPNLMWGDDIRQRKDKFLKQYNDHVNLAGCVDKMPIVNDR